MHKIKKEINKINYCAFLIGHSPEKDNEKITDPKCRKTSFKKDYIEPTRLVFKPNYPFSYYLNSGVNYIKLIILVYYSIPWLLYCILIWIRNDYVKTYVNIIQLSFFKTKFFYN